MWRLRSGFIAFSRASIGSLDRSFPPGVRPPVNPNLSEIVKFKTKNSENSKNNIFRFRARGHNKNHVGTDPTPTVVTVDSGACDAVCPPHAFKNTPMNTNNHEFNKSYGACGGETVKNIGCKSVRFVSVTGEKHKYEFQIGDRITKPLLAVSKICETGKAVFFGPAPTYDSYIIDDPSCFVVSNGSKTFMNLENGTYNIRVHENTNKTQGRYLAAASDAGEDAVPSDLGADGRPAAGSAAVPPRAPEPRSELVFSAPVSDDHVIESKEDMPVIVKPDPMKPTTKQVEEHLARCHVPYRSWCEECVRASGREDAHKEAKS